MNDTYKIYANTPMGMIKGLLKLETVNNELTGNISFDGKSFDFKNGRYDKNKFSFNGVFKIYFKKINYSANGEINGDDISIFINTSIGNFKIDGKKI